MMEKYVLFSPVLETWPSHRDSCYIDLASFQKLPEWKCNGDIVEETVNNEMNVMKLDYSLKIVA